MNIDEDTSAWLDCPTPLEMYRHQCALLEDELTQAHAMLRKTHRNVAGLVQLGDGLARENQQLLMKFKTRLVDQPIITSDSRKNRSYLYTSKKI